MSTELATALAASTAQADVVTVGGVILAVGVTLYGLAKLRGIFKA